MKKFFKYYDKIEEGVLIGSLMFTVCLTFIQVIMRFVFNNSLSWSEELNRYIFIWQIWLGTSIGLRDKKHIKVDLLYTALKGRGKLALDFIANLSLLVFSIYFTYYGAILVQGLMARKAVSVAMKLPMSLVYAAIPVSSLMVSLRVIQNLLQVFKSQPEIDGGDV